MNRAMRRLLGVKKAKHTNWTCPQCETHYAEIYDQAHNMPYIFCFRGCEDYFDHDGNNITTKLFPGGKPWGESEK